MLELHLERSRSSDGGKNSDLRVREQAIGFRLFSTLAAAAPDP
jgi:hypothetical protein